MEAVKHIMYGIVYGFIDSIKGIALVFYIDSQIARLNELKNAQKLPNDPSAPIIEEPYSEERRIEKITGANKAKSSAPGKVSKSEPKIMKQVFKCCALNGGFAWLSIVFFEFGVLPALKYFISLAYGSGSEELQLIWGWLQSLLSIVFGLIWVLPIFCLSRIVSSLWFQDIANEAYRFRKGRPQLIPSVSKLIADTLFSLLVQFLFLIQSMLINLLPIRYLGSFLCFVHLCLLYSLYSFEYKWFNMGWELHKRLSYIETNWPYFLGFGIPLTVVTSWPSSIIVSGCVFSIIFPIFILSGNEAQPVVGACEFPLKLFSPVVWVSNLLFTRTVATRSTITRPATARATPSPSEYNRSQRPLYPSHRPPRDRSSSRGSSSSRVSAASSSFRR